MSLTQAYAKLQRRDTGAKFYVPPSNYEVAYSWDYCSRWTKISTPYLSQSMEKVHWTTMKKKELLRETIYIIDHLRPLCEFVPKAVEISVVMGNSYAKQKSSVSSSKKGKAKVYGGNKKTQKKKNKRTLDDQSPIMANSHGQSPIEVNFKRACYDHPNHSNDSSTKDA